MTSFEFGDVVLVAFPFSDLQRTKQRPAVLISSAAFNAAQSDVVIAAITSQTDLARALSARISDWRSAGLLRESTIKPTITSIEKRLILRTLGKLVAVDKVRLRDMLTSLLG